MDERPDSSDDEDHQRGERIDAQRERHVQVGRRDPGEDGLLDRVFRRGRRAAGDGDRDAERGKHRPGRKRTGDPLGETSPNTCVDQEAHERQQWDERYHFRLVNASGLSVSLWRKSAMMIASPTAASAAATVMTKKTMI